MHGLDIGQFLVLFLDLLFASVDGACAALHGLVAIIEAFPPLLHAPFLFLKLGAPFFLFEFLLFLEFCDLVFAGENDILRAILCFEHDPRCFFLG